MRGTSHHASRGLYPKSDKATPTLHISTSFVERQNLTMRMAMRRFTRLTNAFSKKLSHLKAAVALHLAYCNFCGVHSSLRVISAKDFSANALDHPIWTQMVGVPIPTPGNEYGRPRNFPGVNNFSQWLFQLYQNQQQQPQPKACVEVDDGLGNHSKSCD
jgi:hypothetical protein